MLKKINNKGFTIIEVLIVLAIAGVIMLVVFLAVPALQRNSRNTQRTADASLILSAVNECLTNRNGVVTSCDQDSEIGALLDVTKLRQLNGDGSGIATIFKDDTFVKTATATVAPSDQKTVTVAFGKKCSTDGSASAAGDTGTSRQFVLIYNAESASGSVTRCIDS